MTINFHHVLTLYNLYHNRKPVNYLFFDNSRWNPWLKYVYDLLLQIHLNHFLEFTVTFLCYYYVWPVALNDIRTHGIFNPYWITLVFSYNLVSLYLIYSLWHYFTYTVDEYHDAVRTLQNYKFNPVNQYEGKEGKITLVREIFYSTLGMLHSAALQCIVMVLYSQGKITFYEDFWTYPVFSIVGLCAMTYWRAVHFYLAHRVMHPYGWWNRRHTDLKGTLWPYLDLGQFLYSYSHSLHHKSYNPGPWSGLSMHWFEHLLYYTCAWLPLLYISHPLHFLYAKFHCDISPLLGHDGLSTSSNGFHWLHHHLFDCNYGGRFFPVDSLMGTQVDYEDWIASGKGSLKKAQVYIENKKRLATNQTSTVPDRKK